MSKPAASGRPVSFAVLLMGRKVIHKKTVNNPVTGIWIIIIAATTTERSGPDLATLPCFYFSSSIFSINSEVPTTPEVEGKK
nr:hypothetical protein [Escherichia coli]